MPAAAQPRPAGTRRARREPSPVTQRDPSRRRGGRLLAGLAAAVAALTAAYFLWLRDAELVRIEHTTVTGLTTGEAPEIRSALMQAAGRMTTLNVDVARLEQAVARYPEVGALQVDADFPHGLAIEVEERRPIAAVPGPGRDPVAVAADGTLLPDARRVGALAELPADGASTGERLEDPPALAALDAVAAAPPGLGRRIEAVRRQGTDGLVAELRAGQAVVLGGPARLEAKWLAAAAVMRAGAVDAGGYLDVSLPQRPAVGP